jgi:hypothetical protein
MNDFSMGTVVFGWDEITHLLIWDVALEGSKGVPGSVHNLLYKWNRVGGMKFDRDSF